MIPLHLGAMHPYEQALTLALAFGPFVVLGIVIAVRHRQDLAEERAEGEVSEPTTPDRPGSRS
jgi:hypothetical protein